MAQGDWWGYLLGCISPVSNQWISADGRTLRKGEVVSMKTITPFEKAPHLLEDYQGADLLVW